MVGWHPQLDGHEFEQALGVGDGQGSLVCCSPWGHKELDTTKQLNWLKDFRGWGGWMTSLNQWTWVWSNSGRRWRTGKPGVLPFMGLQTIRHGWVTEQQWRMLERRAGVSQDCGESRNQVSGIKWSRKSKHQQYMVGWWSSWPEEGPVLRGSERGEQSQMRAVCVYRTLFCHM